MAEGMETSQPMPVREWKLQQQMAEAKQFQEWISEHVEKGQKSQTFPIDEINQVPIYMI